MPTNRRKSYAMALDSDRLIYHFSNARMKQQSTCLVCRSIATPHLRAQVSISGSRVASIEAEPFISTWKSSMGRETLKQIDYDFLSIRFLFYCEFELPQNVTGLRKMGNRSVFPPEND
jgi:hypothetical protein